MSCAQVPSLLTGCIQRLKVFCCCQYSNVREESGDQKTITKEDPTLTQETTEESQDKVDEPTPDTTETIQVTLEAEETRPTPDKFEEPTRDATEEMTSVKYREDGNQWYKGAHANGIAPTIQLHRLEKARTSYYRAYETQENEDEKASAIKNLAVCEWNLGMSSFSNSKTLSQQLSHLKEALRFFQEACHSSKPAEWVAHVKGRYVACCRDVVSKLKEVDSEQRIRVLFQTLPFIDIDDLRADIFLEIAQNHFHVGINALQNGDFHACKYHMDECHFPIYEAQKYGSSREDVISEVEILLEDTRMHRCIGESAQALKTGDELLHTITADLETLNIDMVWEVIDWYKQSILLTRELDMEREAIGLSRLGGVYAKVLKMKAEAKEYHKKSIVIAESMHPRTFNTCDWYKESTDTLRKYQEETVTYEQEQKEKEEAKVKEELIKEFKELKENHLKLKNIEFLKYVYKTFQPKNPEHKLNLDESQGSLDEKKLLQKAVIHYHPDRADPETNGLKWKVLSEEITKLFSSRYEVEKTLPNDS